MHLGVSLLIVSTQCILRIETCLFLVLFLPIVLPLLVSEDKGQSLPVEFLTIPGHFRWYLSDVNFTSIAWKGEQCWLGCTVAFLSIIISMITGNATGTRSNDPILVVFFKKIEIYLIVISDHFLGAKASCCSCKTAFQIFGCKYLDWWTGLKCSSSDNKKAKINISAMKFSSITLPLHKRNCLATPTAEVSFHTFSC